MPIPGSSKVERIKENFDAVRVTFSKEELKEIEEVLEANEMIGGRYCDGKLGPHEHLWG